MRDRCQSRTGVALIARGPEVAGCCPASDRRRLAGHGAGLSACPSSGPSARVAPAAIRTDRGSCVWRGFRHGPWRAVSGPPCPPQARPGDTPLARPFGLAWNGPGPVAGFPPARLGTCPAKTGAASGTPMASASRSLTRHVSAPGPGHSLPLASKRSRSIRQRECGDYGMGVEGVEKETISSDILLRFIRLS